MEYKLLKPITFAAVLEAEDRKCLKFIKEYSKFLDWGIAKFVAAFSFSDPICFDYIEATFNDHPEWELFLVEKGFIRKEKIIYKKGSILVDKASRSEWMISSMEENIPKNQSKMTLICIGPPNYRFFATSYNSKSHQVEDPDNITADEMREICNHPPDYELKE